MINKQSSWENDFDKLAIEAHFSSDAAVAFRLDKIKSFITQALSSQKQRMMEVLEKEKLPVFPHGRPSNSDLLNRGYNQALDTAINIIKES